jgi:hypothetical protein
MALHRRISTIAKNLARPLGAVTAGAVALGLAVTGPTLAAHASTTPVSYGTLVTQTWTAATEDKAGVTMAMMELNWAAFEPKQNVVSSSYVASVKSQLAAYHAAGMKVTLSLGMAATPSWVFNLANATYTDQNGNSSTEADFVFSQAVRQAAATYMSLVNTNLPLTNFWAIRLTSGGDGEMLYPSDTGYWAFNNAALTGKGLPSGMKPNPYPSWRPGHSGLTAAQIDRWVNWYVGGLDNVTNWQMQNLSRLGFTGYYETVTPGDGTRPDDLAYDEQHNLPDDGTTDVGAVWDRYYSMLPTKTNVIAYVSSVADLSGNDDSCQASDTSLALTSPTMDSWSATRWIARIAAANKLLVGGENPGYGMPASLDAHYTDTSSSGMMADAIRQARSCGFKVFYWAHDIHLWDGTLPFSLYQQMINS